MMEYNTKENSYHTEEILQTMMPDWRLDHEIGDGSYGTVYRIAKKDDFLENAGLVSESALKVIHIPKEKKELDTLSRSKALLMESKSYYAGQAVELSNEIKLLEVLKNAPNVVHIEDYFGRLNEDGISWTIVIRMELLRSIETVELWEEGDVIRLGMDICSALAVCARKNIIHRDIKPSNLFITEFGDFKLGDFGISRVMGPNTATLTSQVGTVNYVAPEVVKLESYDHRADIYSLGIVLYYLMNNQRHPFCPVEKQILNNKDKEDAVIRRVRGEPLPPPVNASSKLAEVILKACAPRQEDRYATAEEFRAALEKVYKPGGTDIPGEDKPGGTDIPGEDKPGGTDIPGEDKSGGTDILGEDKPGGTDIPGEDKPGGMDGPREDKPGEADGPEENDDPDKPKKNIKKRILLTVLLVELILAGIVGYMVLRDVKNTLRERENSIPYERESLIVSIPPEPAETDAPAEPDPLPETDQLPDAGQVPETDAVELVASMISVREKPEKMTYQYGDAFDPTGLVLDVMSNLGNGYMTEGYDWTPRTFTELGEVSVMISLGGQTIPLVVQVESPFLFELNEDGESWRIVECEDKTLTSVTIPTVYDGKPVTEISTGAFDSCALTELEIPEGIVVLEGRAFMKCNSLTSLRFPSTLREISSHNRDDFWVYGAFAYCPSLESIRVAPGNPVYYSNGNCVIETKTQTVIAGCKGSVIPSDGSVTAIGEGAFDGCEGLTRLTIPESITQIGANFISNTSIESLHLPASATELSLPLFENCNALLSLTVAEDNPVYRAAGNCIIERGTGVLVTGCSISELPDDGSITAIKANAFSGAERLAYLTIPEGVTKIGEWAFSASGLLQIILPASLTEIGEGAFNACNNLQEIIVAEDNPVYYSDGGRLIERSTGAVIAGGGS